MRSDRFGPYELAAPVGSGGSATVYKAYEPRLDRYVALKILPETLLARPGFVERFEREARALARLEHEHVVPLYGFGIDGGTPWMAMRLFESGTLEQAVRARPGLRAALPALRGVASALDAAHALGIVHRDVKPGNVLLDASGKAYLSDFGIAATTHGAHDLTGSSVIGTPRYASPEQALGQPVDGRADVYSLGVVAFEIATGRVPFNGPTSYSVLKQHVEDPPPLELLPRGLRATIGRALDKNPARRWPTASAFVDALAVHAAADDGERTPPTLADLASGTPTPDGAAQTTQRLRTRGRRRARAWTFGALLAIAGGAVAWVLAGSPLDLGSAAADAARPAATAEDRGLPLVRVSSFVVAGDDPGDAALAKGLQAEIVAAGARMSTLRTLATAVDDIAVPTHRLDGLLRRDGDTVRLSLQLTDVRDGELLWSEQFDFDPHSRSLDYQVETALSALRAIRLSLDTAGRYAPGFPTTGSREADVLYGHALSKEVLRKYDDAHELLHAALARDAQFAQAHAMLARIAVSQAGMELLPLEQAKQLVRAELDAARALQPELPEAYVAEGWARLWLEQDRAGALAAFDAAEARAPELPLLQMGRAFALRNSGRFEEALAVYERMVAKDPLERWAMSNVALVLQELRRYDEAEAFLTGQGERWTAHVNLGIWRMRARFLASGDLDQLERDIGEWQRKFQWPDADPRVLSLRIQARALRRDYAGALAMLERFPERCLTNTGYPNLIDIDPCVDVLKPTLLRAAGRDADARALLEKTRRTPPAPVTLDHYEEWAMLIVNLALAGDCAPAQATLEKLLALLRDELEPSSEMRGGLFAFRASIHAWCGEPAQALDALEVALDTPFGVHAATVAHDPLWLPLHAQPRFRQLLDARGHPLAE